MIEVYGEVRTVGTDHGDRWLDWVHTNFNHNNVKPEEGKFAVQSVLRWSPIKLVLWGVAPILLSLVIGFWYMFKPTPGEDSLTVVQTAWGIASYIITAAACRSFSTGINGSLRL